MRKYPTYKLSGVDWLGEIPIHWNRNKVKFLAKYINGVAFKPEDWKESNENGKPIIRIQNLTEGKSSYNYFNGEKDEKYIIRNGDFLISWSASLGFYVWTGDEAWLNQHIFKVDKISNLVIKIFYKWLAS